MKSDFARDLDRGLALHRQNTPRARRAGAMLQLKALIQLAELAMPEDSRFLLTPAYDLLETLVGMELGFKADMLSPENKSNAPKLPIHESANRARAAVAMELLMHQGMRRDEAARKVARDLRLKHPKKGRYEANDIMQWRDEAIKGLPMCGEFRTGEAKTPVAFRYEIVLHHLNWRFRKDFVAAYKFLINQQKLVAA